MWKQVWWQFLNLYLFKSCFPNFWGNLNVAKVLFSYFDSFREFSSVKDLSCTDINIISDLARILLGSVEPCGSNHHTDRNAHGSSRGLDLFSHWSQNAWSECTWRGEYISPLTLLGGVLNREPGGHMEELILLLGILQTTEGMRATSMACRHLLWHLLSAGITDGMTMAWWWGGIVPVGVWFWNFLAFLVTLCRLPSLCAPTKEQTRKIIWLFMRSLHPPTSVVWRVLKAWKWSSRCWY